VITIEEAKRLARELSGQQTNHSRVLEAVAHAAGFRDWNTFAASAGRSAESAAPKTSDEQLVVPILRVFDHRLARDFYCDFLDFEWEWDHQYEDDMPVYAAVHRGAAVLHLSEHHGDATPGSGVLIVESDLAGYHTALLAKRHRNARPGISANPWGDTMTIADPFGNRLVFWQRQPATGS
jgi:catechol 2,3-dioxygenase-like lactoylglutathione lyase family enzyme